MPVIPSGEISYYLNGLQFSILLLNSVAGFYFVMVRFVDWGNFNEIRIMERQGKLFLMFCIFISFIHAAEVDSGSNFIGWAVVMALQFSTGALLGLFVNKYFN